MDKARQDLARVGSKVQRVAAQAEQTEEGTEARSAADRALSAAHRLAALHLSRFAVAESELRAWSMRHADISAELTEVVADIDTRLPDVAARLHLPTGREAAARELLDTIEPDTPTRRSLGRTPPR